MTNSVVLQSGASAEARAIILSLEETASLDTTALDALVECDVRLKAAGKKLYLARVKQGMIDMLVRAGAKDLASKEIRHWSVAGAWDEAKLYVEGMPPKGEEN